MAKDKIKQRVTGAAKYIACVHYLLGIIAQGTGKFGVWGLQVEILEKQMFLFIEDFFGGGVSNSLLLSFSLSLRLNYLIYLQNILRLHFVSVLQISTIRVNTRFQSVFIS